MRKVQERFRAFKTYDVPKMPVWSDQQARDERMKCEDCKKKVDDMEVCPCCALCVKCCNCTVDELSRL